jgi:hypothetical protein
MIRLLTATATSTVSRRSALGEIDGVHLAEVLGQKRQQGAGAAAEVGDAAPALLRQPRQGRPQRVAPTRTLRVDELLLVAPGHPAPVFGLIGNGWASLIGLLFRAGEQIDGGAEAALALEEALRQAVD